jgi:phosphopantetheine adenylyltransferase
MAIAHLNHAMADIPTVFFPTAAELSYVSSGVAKELLRHKDNSDALKALRQIVPEPVAAALLSKA